jgi:Icc-related predicted phosphoesterase
MRVKLIADVHGDIEAVKREAATCDVLLLLGDLINVIDYDNAGGIIAEVYGSDAVRAWAAHRKRGRFEESRQVLRDVAAGREEEMRALMVTKIDEAHEAFCSQVPDNVLVTFGNVDVPDLVRKYLPAGVRFVDAEVVDLDGVRFGFVGGGLPKVGIPGEVSLPDYAAKVGSLGPVDVLCAHVPPAVDDLTYDVVAEFAEPGSEALLDYVRTHEPGHVYFGHVHQPRCERMSIGPTTLVNVGCHFRTTNTAVVHPSDG